MSDEDMQRSKHRTGLSKRQTIKSFGVAGGALLFPYGTVTSAVRDEYTGESVLRKASPNDPLTPSEVRSLQSDAIQAFKDKTGTDEILGGVVPDTDTDIIAIGFHVGPVTGASLYLGTIPKGAHLSNGIVAERHRAAAAHVKDAQADNRTRSGVATASDSGSSDPSNWDTDVASYYINYDDKPNGSLYDSGTVYEKAQSDEWAYGIDHVHRPNPGANTYPDSSIDLVESICRHKWGAYDAGYITPHDYFPDSDERGDFSVSGSAGFITAEVSVEYDPPEVYRTTKAEPNGTDDFYWNWEHPTTTSSDHTFRPVSIARSYDRATSSSSASNRLFELYTMAEWDNAEVTDRSVYVYVD